MKDVTKLYERVLNILEVTHEELPNIEQNATEIVARAKESGLTDDATDTAIREFIDKAFVVTKDCVIFTKDTVCNVNSITKSVSNIRKAFLKK